MAAKKGGRKSAKKSSGRKSAAKALARDAAMAVARTIFANFFMLSLGLKKLMEPGHRNGDEAGEGNKAYILNKDRKRVRRGVIYS